MEAAVVRGDVAFLDRALSKDFIFTHGDGWTSGGAPLKVDTKTTWLEYVKKQPLPYVYRELDSVQVELHGDIAITVGRYYYLPRTNNPAPTTSHLYVWFERVYQKQNGRWQHLSHRTVKGPVREDDATTVASAK
jgi:ketosteroid isomerase-like protein